MFIVPDFPSSIRTPLLIDAVSKNDVTGLKVLLSNPKTSGKEKVNGISVLNYALIKSLDMILHFDVTAECLNMILEQEFSDVSLKNEGGLSLIHYVAQHGSSVALHSLLTRKDFNYNDKDLKGNNALHLIAHHPLMTAGHLECVNILLGLDDFDVNATDAFGDTALMAAVRRGHTSLVEILIKHPKVDVNATNAFKGSSALQVALYLGNVEIFNLILSRPEVKLNNTSLQGYSALHCLVLAPNISESHLVCLERLLAYPEFDINITSTDGHAALTSAVFAQHYTVAERLVKRLEVPGNEISSGNLVGLGLYYFYSPNKDLQKSLTYFVRAHSLDSDYNKDLIQKHIEDIGKLIEKQSRDSSSSVKLPAIVQGASTLLTTLFGVKKKTAKPSAKKDDVPEYARLLDDNGCSMRL